MPDSTEHSAETLQEMRSEILQTLEEIGANENGDLVGELGLQEGFADAGAAASARADLIRRVQSLVARLASVDEALRHVDSGDYGICAECGKAISEERLEFRPNSVLCVACKSAG